MTMKKRARMKEKTMEREMRIWMTMKDTIMTNKMRQMIKI